MLIDVLVNGNMYFKLGFNFSHQTNANYWWIGTTNLYNRYQTQKHKLKNLLENFDEKLSESENMVLNHFNKIYDCGNLVFVKTCN